MNYTLIHTEDASNPGDELLTKNAEQILNNVFNGHCKYSFKYMEKPENCIDKINSTDVCFISTIIYNDYDVEKYYDLITQIKVPIIALTSTIAIQRYEKPNKIKLNNQQRDIIKIVNQYSGIVPVRDIFTKYILENNGIENVKLVEVLGLFNFGNPIQKMKQPSEIKKILITAGHQLVYWEQLIDVVSYLSKKFPNAEFTYSTHTLPDRAFDFSTTKLKNLNIKTLDTSVSCDKLDCYKNFDLHVGYRLHGHIKSLSVGVPSILIAEDSRGLGQKYTLNNLGAFTGFNFNMEQENINKPSELRYNNTFEKLFSIKYIYTESKYLVVTILGIKCKKNLGCIIQEVKDSNALIEEIDKHLDWSLYTNWIFYSIIPITINTLYKDLFLPFLRNSINNVITK